MTLRRVYAGREPQKPRWKKWLIGIAVTLFVLRVLAELPPAGSGDPAAQESVSETGSETVLPWSRKTIEEWDLLLAGQSEEYVIQKLGKPDMVMELGGPRELIYMGRVNDPSGTTCPLSVAVPQGFVGRVEKGPCS